MSGQRTKTWKESPDPDPDRDATLDRIEHVLEHFPDRVFAFDEFGPLGIRPAAGSCWAKQGKPDRLPATYRRTHGVTYFHGCYSVGDVRLWDVNRHRKGTVNTLAALKSIRAARPDGAPIYIIMDNLPAHTGADIRRWANKNRVELCFTPTYASWANPIEAHFGPLRQFTLANSNHPNHPVQTRALHAYLRWRNANARHPDMLAAQRKERARIRSEKGHPLGRQTTTGSGMTTQPGHSTTSLRPASARTRARSRGQVAIGQWPGSRSTYAWFVERCFVSAEQGA